MWIHVSSDYSFSCCVGLRVLDFSLFLVSPVQINLPSTMKITKGLPACYTAVQMHLHWGGWDLEASGAEHTVDGIRYMAEVRHFVVLISLLCSTRSSYI